MSNIIEAVRDSLDLKNISPDVLNKVPFLVTRAVTNLQKKEVLPPKIWEFVAKTQKQEKRDTDFDLEYNYVVLPKDFLRLKELYIADNKDQADTTAGYPYQFTSYENYITKLKTNTTSQKWFTITDVEDKASGKYHKILIANPFPKDNIMVRVQYYVDGTEDDFRHIDRRYWEVVITEVERILGIVSREEAENIAADESLNNKQSQGKVNINRTSTRTKVSFFGNKTRSYTGKTRLR